MNIDIDCESIKRLAVDAGKKILEIYEKTGNQTDEDKKNQDQSVSKGKDKSKKNLDVQYKKDDSGFISPLTEADTEANKIIVEGLKKISEVPILSEEEKDNKKRLSSDAVWVVDPLDGTKEFIKRNGEFTVNIALVVRSRPILGVIYVPVYDELFVGVDGEGTFFSKGLEPMTKISVSDKNTLKDSTLVMSRSHPSDELLDIVKKMEIKEAIKSGSSLKGCIVALAQAELYLRLGPVSEWDICAMDIIVHEAGGIMTDLDGAKLEYNKRNVLIDSGFLVSNGKVHSDSLKIVQEVKNSSISKE